MTGPFLSLKLPRRPTSTSLVRKCLKFSPTFFHSKILEVELLVVRAISLNLVKGVIDEVDEKVHMTWVQPRVLNTEQVWESDVSKWHLTKNLIFVDWKNGRKIGLLGTRSFSNRKINRGKCQTHSDMLDVDLAPSRCHLEPAAESDLLSLQYFSHVNPTDTCYVRFLSFSWLLLRLLSNFIWK